MTNRILLAFKGKIDFDTPDKFWVGILKKRG